MFEIIFFLVVLLILFGIFLLIVVGLFIGVAYLMMYFLPTIDLVNALIPAAILTTVPIIMICNTFKQLINDSIYKSNIYSDYEDEDEGED